MEKRYFQTEELELKCIASFQKTIADFQEQVIIKAFNSEYLLSRNVASSNNGAAGVNCPSCPWPTILLLLFLLLQAVSSSAGR